MWLANGGVENQLVQIYLITTGCVAPPPNNSHITNFSIRPIIVSLSKTVNGRGPASTQVALGLLMPQPGLSSVLYKELLSLPTFTMVLTLVIQGTAKNMETIISWESHNYEDTFHLSLLPEAVSIDCQVNSNIGPQLVFPAMTKDYLLLL